MRILGEYKVIGDTTYGLGFKEAEELVDKLAKVWSDHVEAVRKHAFNKGYEEGKLSPH